uniref:AcidPPc domain-containing protein n=1 Tax=Panagrellus redivivus TaxID=6233 RepID=A0A7E5A258_PANRE
MVSLVISWPILHIMNAFVNLLPYQMTGFFCDDDEIRHPYVDDTVTYGQMALFFETFGVVCILLCEASCLLQAIGQWSLTRKSHYSAVFMNGVLAVLIYTTLHLALNNIFDLGKLTTSRLRPNFIDYCQPANLTQLCGPDADPHRFIEGYTCTRDNFKLFDEYESFPSGHSGYAAFMATLLILYLHHRCRIPRPIVAGIQLFLATSAFYIIVSRVKDYKHRLSDVSTGASIGVALAYYAVEYSLHGLKAMEYYDIVE